MSFMKNLIDIGTESFTDQQTCTVNLSVTTKFCSVTDVTDTDQGGLQVIYDVTFQVPHSVLSCSFSFDELRKFPLKCKDWFENQVMRLPVEYPARKDLVDKVLKHAVYLADRRHVEGHIDSGYKFDVTLETLLFSDSKYVRTGKFRGLNKKIKMTCSVCLDDVNDGTLFSFLPCGDVFHSSCIGPCLDSNRTCPNCRFRLPNVSISPEFLEELSSLNARFVRIPSTKPKC